MVKLLKSDIKTTEVLGWNGFHLLHAGMSSCSQKTRIFMNMKGVDWTGHYVDLPKDENNQPWFMGINPRGLVPVLVHDGDVHIESNDIMMYVEELFPEPSLLPKNVSAEGKALLALEDELHMDLRALTFRYVIPTHGPNMKDPEALARYEANSGTVGGKIDPEVQVQLNFWKAANNNGITDAQVKEAVANFNTIFKKLDIALADKTYLLGEAISVADIAWFIYSNRLRLAGYPLDLHQNLKIWFDLLMENEAFLKEITLPPPFENAMKDKQAKLAANGDTLIKTTGLAT